MQPISVLPLNPGSLMMQMPESITAITTEMAKQYGDDIPTAIDQAMAAIKRLPEYKQLVEMLVRNSVQELIYDARHVSNVATKRQAGYYGQPAKVLGASQSVEEVYESTYNYYIAGTMLGLLKGCELSAIADHEQSVSDGHRFNAELCRWLASQVPGESTVQEVIPEKKLRANFKRIYRQVMGKAA